MKKTWKKGTVIKFTVIITILVAFSILLMALEPSPSCILFPPR